ncbi:MAG TPA: nucleotide sugar dehydrogenase [Hydrogenophaga sp.]|uniref:nucleotide sugar dehydrogenase n=1 Tax=Hydrogenophaga sp. TaxID=1904254 RepID=UPI002BA9BDE1|nr:nucleotide sugar dehydrogenase [Hydrogenophaga sp.]HSX91825.1 nucleotide sugar dehydrogenase [Hydrogenophaga sp.]
MNVSVFGLGYVGAVSCACLPELGHDVVGVDISPRKIELINSGQSPVVERGINELITAAVNAGRLRATQDAFAAVRDTDVSLISVATPANDDQTPDLSAVLTVVKSIGEAIAAKEGHHTVVLRSTVQPGTTAERIAPVLQASAGRRIGERLSLVFNPEFLREGSSVEDFHRPPQTVIGSLDPYGHEVMDRLYHGLPGAVVHTTVEVAESVKYLCNVFHALKIVFANETGTVLKACGLDAREVMRIFCQDHRLNISPAYLRPGFAFGGSCLPKEVKGFLTLAHEKNVAIPTIGGLLDSNAAHIERAYRMIARDGRRKVALFGLAFKPGTDDLRDSPLVVLAERLIGRGFDIAIYDNCVEISRLLGKNKEFIQREIPHLNRLLGDTPAAVLEGAQIVVVGHADAQARQAVIAAAPGKRIVDLSGYADIREAATDFDYEGICW